jgi:hypothetical protein
MLCSSDCPGRGRRLKITIRRAHRLISVAPCHGCRFSSASSNECLDFVKGFMMEALFQTESRQIDPAYPLTEAAGSLLLQQRKESLNPGD